MNLRLDDDTTAEAGGDRLHLLRGRGHLTAGNGDPMSPEDLPRLVFVDVHRFASSAAFITTASR
jgi:hypothetical protein